MMKSNLHPRVLETIERHSMMRPGDCVGIGVSGGADSVALLRLLAELRSQLGVQILVLHFHHQLRGAEADEDESFVFGLARQLGFEFISDRADVAGVARCNGWNLEDAARRLRYQFFASTGASRGLNRVAVAHTADDQAETVLAHLLRGTGPAGLAGIYPVAGLIIRPLLDIRRDDLRNYLLALNQPWREDASNQDTSRMRARIRHQLLPLLQQDFEPASVTLLARLAGLAREEEIFWRALEDERFAALVTREPGEGVSLGIADLLSPFPPLAPKNLAVRRDAGFPQAPVLALTRRLVRRIFFELCGSRQQLTARHVEDVLHLATKSQSGSRIELPGVLVERLFDRLVFSPASPAGAEKVVAKYFPGPQFEYAIALPSASEPACIVVPEIHRRFNLKIIDWPSVSRETVMKTWSILDIERLSSPLILRNWRPGDSYRPYRRRRVRKLKRLLLAARIPRRDRTGWPVLTSAGALVWALGCPVADEFAPRSGTRTGLVIAEEEF